MQDKNRIHHEEDTMAQRMETGNKVQYLQNQWRNAFTKKHYISLELKLSCMPKRTVFSWNAPSKPEININI